MLDFLELHFRKLWEETFEFLHYTGPRTRRSLEFTQQFGYIENIDKTNRVLRMLLDFYNRNKELQNLLRYSTHKVYKVKDGQKKVEAKLRLHFTTT